jgi:hypothetical protein
VPIPGGTIGPLFDEFDLDQDGKLSREEFDSLPDLLKKQFPASYRRAAPAAEESAGEEPDEAAGEPKKKPAAKKPAAKKVARVKKEPIEEEAPAEEPVEEAAPAAKPKVAAKTAVEEKPFPAAGLPIPESIRALAARYDLNHDDKLSFAEYDKLPKLLKSKFPGKYARPGGTATAKATATAKKKPAVKKPAAEPEEEMMEEEAPEEAATAAKPAAGKEPAGEEPEAEATAKKGTPKEKEPPFPANGVAIPEALKFLLSQYDKNGDSRLDKSEYDQVPPGTKKLLQRVFR